MTSASVIGPLAAVLLAGAYGYPAGLGRTEASTRGDNGPWARTDDSVYTAHRRSYRRSDGVMVRWVELSIGSTYTNASTRPIYFTTCHAPGPPSLEKKQAGKWITAYAPVVLTCLTEPLVVPPRGTYRFVLQVRGYVPGLSELPEFNTSVPGTYRLKWHKVFSKLMKPYDAGQPENQLPESTRISNEFRIREP